MDRWLERERKKEGGRERIIHHSTVLGIVINIFLALAKVTVGFFSHSISVLADGVNNAFDIVSAVASLWGVKLAKRPPDRDHPYGHGRIEYVSAVVVALLVAVIALEFFKASVERALNPEPLVIRRGFLGIMTLSILLKLLLAFYYKKAGAKTESMALRALATDTVGDVLTSLVVLIPLLWRSSFPLDGIVGILVSLMIFYNAFSILRESINPLIGERPDPKLLEEILHLVESHPGLERVHDLKIHSYGVNRGLVTMDVEVPGDLTVAAIHPVVDHAERAIEEKYSLRALIHVDPSGAGSPAERRLRRNIESILSESEYFVALYDLWQRKDRVYLEVLARPAKEGSPEPIFEALLRGNEPNLSFEIKVLLDFEEDSKGSGEATARDFLP